MLAGQSEAPEQTQRKYYTGIASCSLVGVNLSAEEMAAVGIIREDQIEKAKQKDGKHRDDEKKEFRLDFWFKVQERVEKDVFVKLTMSVWPEETKPSSKGSIQVINTLHRTAYVTQEQFDAKADLISEGKTEPWFTAPYRKAMKGEDKLYELLKLVAGENRTVTAEVIYALNYTIQEDPNGVTLELNFRV
jgi:hypothetical protein